MTATHLSHFGLTHFATSGESIMFHGSKADCKRMAFAHGMEVEKYEGRALGCDGGRLLSAPADSENFSFCFFKGGGFIHRERDGYLLLMPLEVWEQPI